MSPGAPTARAARAARGSGVDDGAVQRGGFGAGDGAGERRSDGEPAAFAMRRNARTLHAACAELLPGYAAASREPWRQALLTAGCLAARPGRSAARRPAPPLIVEDVVQPSDVLCALWLARRCGLFCPGSSCGDAVGRRSACDIVPAFAADVSGARRDAVWEALRANMAWQAHRAARVSIGAYPPANVNGGFEGSSARRGTRFERDVHVDPNNRGQRAHRW
jgi:hypothetical protein